MPHDRTKVSVIEPVPQAWDRLVAVLFRPRDRRIWLGLAFALFLAGLFKTVLKLGSHIGKLIDWSNLVPLPQRGELAAGYFTDHGSQLLQLFGGLLIAGLIVYLPFTWVACRGKFMFLGGLVARSGAVREPWREHAKRARQLFVFKVVITYGTWVFTAGYVLLVQDLPTTLWLFMPQYLAHDVPQSAVWGVPIGISVLTVVWLVYLKAVVVTSDFIVPMMLADRSLGPWRAWWIWLTHHLRYAMWPIVLFYLMRGIYTSAIGALGFVTCCLTCSVAAWPFVQAVVLLPAFAFDRLYSAYFVEQFGERWQLFDATGDPASPHDA